MQLIQIQVKYFRNNFMNNILFRKQVGKLHDGL